MPRDRGRYNGIRKPFLVIVFKIVIGRFCRCFLIFLFLKLKYGNFYVDQRMDPHSFFADPDPAAVSIRIQL